MVDDSHLPEKRQPSLVDAKDYNGALLFVWRGCITTCINIPAILFSKLKSTVTSIDTIMAVIVKAKVPKPEREITKFYHLIVTIVKEDEVSKRRAIG